MPVGSPNRVNILRHSPFAVHAVASREAQAPEDQASPQTDFFSQKPLGTISRFDQ